MSAPGRGRGQARRARRRRRRRRPRRAGRVRRGGELGQQHERRAAASEEPGDPRQRVVDAAIAREKYSGSTPSRWSRPNSSGACAAQNSMTSDAMIAGVGSRSGSARRLDGLAAAPNWETSAAIPSATRAGSSARRRSPTGTILARPPRPMPNAVRSVCVNSERDGAARARAAALVPAVAEVVDAARRRLRRPSVGAGSTRRAPRPRLCTGRRGRPSAPRGTGPPGGCRRGSSRTSAGRGRRRCRGRGHTVLVRQRDEDLAAVDATAAARVRERARPAGRSPRRPRPRAPRCPR